MLDKIRAYENVLDYAGFLYNNNSGKKPWSYRYTNPSYGHVELRNSDCTLYTNDDTEIWVGATPDDLRTKFIELGLLPEVN